MRDRELQRGQVLVVFTFSLLLLLLIAGLVFDLGMSWMMRRQEQNAVDPGALAAAQYIPAVALPLAPGNDATPQMVSAACYYARQNGFFPAASTNDQSATGCVVANDPQGATLTVNYPPVGSSAGDYAGRPGFVQVGITRSHASYFLGVIGVTSSAVSASAVAADTTGDANSYSLLALDPSAVCGSGKLGGNGGGGSAKVSITPAPGVTPGSGGYVQVNSTCGGVTSPAQTAMCPSNGTGALQVSGGSSISAPSIFTTGTCGSSGTITTDAGTGMVTQGALQVGDPLAELPPPDPGAYPAGTCNGVTTDPQHAQGCTFNQAGMYVLAPGTYYGGWSIGNNVTLQLESGIYIIAGGGIKLNAGGSITSVLGGSGPAPVMIFSTDDPAYATPCHLANGTHAECQGAIDLEAQATLDVTALTSGPYRGLLLWQDGNGSCTTANCSVTIGGQTTMSISGTIYAPKVQVTLVGGGSVGGTAAVQIISWQWMIGGGSNLTMPYDPSQLYHLEQRGLVH